MTETEKPHTPPTAPGALGKQPELPLSRLAIWALGCGAVGLIVTPLAIAGIVLGIVALRRLARQKGERQGHGLAIGGIATGAVGLVLGVFYALMIWSILLAVDQTRVAGHGVQMSAIHNFAISYANKHQKYPEHVALLAADPTLAVPIDRLVARGFKRRKQNGITVGSYDFADYDGSYKADQAVIAAVESIDTSAPIYQFGEVHFVRLVAPANEPGLIFSWRTNPDTGAFVVIFDDGSTNSGLTKEEWKVFGEGDARARARLGLEPLALPADP